ncbi:MAG: UDP-3-O-acyl-N-acetylglucosamine deacetylase [Holosporales bacterium]|jgi:UDP-3-O-[3-hydroxymyristoyl] N-acetylglucosamine deacetylase|nr:UDP-3-O-acyl-N-acetylglucosamine deacetylase [Holosporales bacterium]
MNIGLRAEATINSAVEFSGIGVHSGSQVKMKVLPAQKETGILFKRTDVFDKHPFIKLSPNSVVNPVLCTRIANKDGISVAVIEHLLAAFRIAGITNALVEIDFEEVPIMDGSAKVFFDEFRKTGLLVQDSFVPAIVIESPVSTHSKDGHISITPSDAPKINVKLSYDRINPVVKDNNCYAFNLSNGLSNLAKARTFGWLEDFEKIKSLGLGHGASEENTVIIMPDNSIKNELRDEKELVMHKCLDLLGDISVIGYDIIGEINGVNTSHALNNMLMRKLLSEIKLHRVISGNNEAKYSNIDFALC